MRRILLSLFFLAGLVTSAGADVVAPEPKTCPHGSRPNTCHGGPHCAIAICQSKADCPSNQECRPIQACFGKLNCGGNYWPRDATIPLRTTMQSACPSSGVCSDNQACQTESLCVSAGGNATETTITTATVTSQQTSLATSGSTSTSTAQGTDTAVSKLGDSGCSCRIGDWASANAFGPWLLAGMFSVVVTLVRRRRGPRK